MPAKRRIKEVMEKGTVLVVDDTIANLELIISFLSKKGYKTLIAKDGETAINRAEDSIPDLILLDIQMPGIDGFETCKRLKNNPLTSEIPIIFMTALTETSDKVNGFKVGGVDYITKPLDCVELLARVDTHISLSNAKKELVNQNEILKENANLRESMEQIMRHDLKSPLTSLIMIPQVLLRRGDYTERQIKLIKTMEKSGLKMLQMINRSMDIYKMEKNIYKPKLVKIDIIKIIASIIEIFDANNEMYNTHILLNNEKVSQGSECLVLGEEMLLYSLFSNLIKNAYEASPRTEKITFMIEKNDFVTIKIDNKGVVPQTIRNSFFNKFTTFGKESGVGLGTYSAKLIVETLGGSIDLDSSIEDHTVVIVKLPYKK